MKKLLSIAALVSLGFSATVVMPYGSYVNYSNKAAKDKAVIGGIYLSYFKSPFKLELDPEMTNIKYKDNTPDWKQKDLTAVLHYYKGYNWDFKVGIHNIFIDQAGNSDNYDKVLFGGILYYKYLKYNMGVDYYYSSYDGFNVNQITPKIGFNFGNYYSKYGSFYAEAKLNYIKISESNVANKDNYTDVDLKLQNFKGKWTTEIYGNIGKNAYKVANDGFVVYNTGGEYKYNAGINVNYYVNKTVSLKIGIGNSKYTINNNDVFSTTYIASVSKTF